MTMSERYQSNDWLVPIVRDAKEALADFNHEEALTIATAVFAEKCHFETEVPWEIVFPSEDIDNSLDRLEAALLMSKGTSLDELLADPRIQNGASQIKSILSKESSPSGNITAFAARHVFRAIHGNQEEDCHVYSDHARNYPQYAGDWLKELTKQFGDDFRDRLVREHSNFFSIVEGGILNAAAINPTVRRPAESIPDYIKRALSVAGDTGFGELTTILQRRLTPYRKESYELRGLQFSQT